MRIPDEIGARFGRLRRRLRKVETLAAALAALLLLELSWWAVFLLDRFWDTPAPLRHGLLLAGTGGALLCLAAWTVRWKIRPPGIESLARRVQCRFRTLGDRLLGMVELADPRRRPPGFSPELYQAAIDQVTEAAAGYDFAQSVSSRRAVRLAWAAAVLLGMAACAAAVVPGAAASAFWRWAALGQDVPRYTLVRIAGLEAEGVVVHSEPFVVRGRVGYRSFWKPSEVEARFGRERPLEARIEEGILEIEVPGQHQRRELEVRLGDASARLPLVPVFRPKLMEVSATARLPGYLGQPDRRSDIGTGVLEVPEGSRVSLEGEASRSLSRATLFWGGAKEELEVEGGLFRGPDLPVEEVHFATLDWRDVLGLAPSRPWDLSLRQIPDRAPAIGIEGLGQDIAVLDSEVLALPVQARDDYGVNLFGLDWEAPEGAAVPGLAPDEFHDSSLSRSQTELEVNFYFSPSLHGMAAGDVIAFQGFVTDFLPGREPVRTPAYRVHVVSSAQHAEWVRQRLESLLSNLEEIGWLQESLRASAEGLLSDPGIEDGRAGERLQDQIGDQNRNAAQLEELASQGLEILREAMRNSRFSDAIMEEWSQTLGQMRELASQSMPRAAGSLSQAAARPRQRQRHLESSVRTQEEILQALEQMQSRINRDLDTMEAMTLADRLRTIGRDQARIEEALMDQAGEDVLGRFPEELAPRHQAANRRLAEEQAASGESAGALQQEIGRFFERTGEEPYGEVEREMKEAETVDSLQEIGELIRRNIAMQATDSLFDWAARFGRWADLLSPPEEDGGGGGGGEGEGEDLTRELMALLRLRERELSLRIRTELLDRRQQELAREELDVQASGLRDDQREIRARVDEVAAKLAYQDIETALLETRDHMDQASAMLDVPQVGDPVVAEENLAIDALTDAINLIVEQARQGAPGQSSLAQQLAMMMEMASTGQQGPVSPSPSAGGNPSGGSTDRPPGDMEGDPSGGPDAGRSLRRSSGRPDSLPTEFRQAMEHYYRELDRMEPVLAPAEGP